MNVLEAIEKLNELDTKIAAFVKVIMKIDGDKDFNNELHIINEVKNELVKEREILKDRLSKTPLINIR